MLRVVKSLVFSVTESFDLYHGANACHDKSMILISLFCVFIDDGVRGWVGPCRGFKFAVS